MQIVHVQAFTCDHSPRLICDVCDGMLGLRTFYETGRLHTHLDGLHKGETHRHAPPYVGDVAYLDDGPAEPWVPDTTPREE